MAPVFKFQFYTSVYMLYLDSCNFLTVIKDCRPEEKDIGG